MIILKDTNSTLVLTTSSSADIDYSVEYVIISTTGGVPDSQDGKVTSATDTPICDAPTGSNKIQIKKVTLRNTHASNTNDVEVLKDISSITYSQFPLVALLAGECIVYEDGYTWTIFDATGSVKSSLVAAGNNTEIQFNNSGVMGADSDFTWDSTNNILGINGASGRINFTEISSEPSAPAAGILSIYTKSIAGRILPKWKGPSGLDTCFQPAFFGNNIVMWNPGATSGVAFGTVTTAITAGVATLPTTTNQYTAIRRSVFTCATGANLQNSLRTESMFFRGNSGSQGGFFAFCRFGFTTWTTGNRFFVGFTAGTTAVTTGNPSALVNIMGFGIDAADTAFTFMHNDATGTAEKEPISGQPALASSNAYDIYIFAPPSSNIVYYRMDNLIAQTTLVNSSVNTELPVDTTMLNFHCAIGSGANAGAAVAAFGLNRMYVETDY